MPLCLRCSAPGLVTVSFRRVQILRRSGVLRCVCPMGGACWFCVPTGSKVSWWPRCRPLVANPSFCEASTGYLGRRAKESSIVGWRKSRSHWMRTSRDPMAIASPSFRPIRERGRTRAPSWSAPLDERAWRPGPGVLGSARVDGDGMEPPPESAFRLCLSISCWHPDNRCPGAPEATVELVGVRGGRREARTRGARSASWVVPARPG
jgi:hypothetical protein